MVNFVSSWASPHPYELPPDSDLSLRVNIRTFLSLILAFSFAGASVGLAQTAIVENFSTAGGLTGTTPTSGLSGATWTNISGSTGLTVSSGALTIAGAAGEAAQLNFNATDVATGTVYLGFDFTVNAAGSISTNDTVSAIVGFRSGTAASGNYALSFGDFRPSATAQTTSSAPSTTTSQVAVGIFTSSSFNASSAPLSVWSAPLTRGTTYRVVLGFDATNNTGSLWINPTSINSTSISLTGVSNDPRGIFVREGATTHGSSTFDNLSVSTSFATASAIPEPSTYAAIAGVVALIGAVILRRRRK